MPFVSPRFAGDHLLEEILKSGDTGERKLGPGSPAPSVRRVQQALFDLTWSLLVDPPVIEEARFVDGDYGPATTRVVLAYKRHYDIHFPPSAPTGSFDGFTGPRTLGKLDFHVVLLDASRAAVLAKADLLRADGHRVELDQTPPRAYPILGTRGILWLMKFDGVAGGILHHPDIGAFEVSGPLWDTYNASGVAKGPLGFPTSDEYEKAEGTIRSDFQHGYLLLDVRSREVETITTDAQEEPTRF
jgi:hypothetical protein